jgi:hypothetical protein
MQVESRKGGCRSQRQASWFRSRQLNQLLSIAEANGSLPHAKQAGRPGFALSLSGTHSVEVGEEGWDFCVFENGEAGS